MTLLDIVRDCQSLDTEPDSILPAVIAALKAAEAMADALENFMHHCECCADPERGLHALANYRKAIQ